MLKINVSKRDLRQQQNLLIITKSKLALGVKNPQTYPSFNTFQNMPQEINAEAI